MANKSKRQRRLESRGLWWSLSDEDLAAAALEDQARALYEADAKRRLDTELNLGRWGVRLNGLHQDTSIRIGDSQDAVRVNLVKAVCETLTAKVGSQRPRPFVLTDGADYTLKTQAKALQKFFDGAYEASEIYQIAPLVFRDAMLSGTGVIGFSADCGRKTITAKRVLPLEILVDPYEAVDGDPRTLLRLQFVDKDDLIELYPEAASEIEDAPSTAPDGTAAQPNLFEVDPRVVRVTHGWRRASYDREGNAIPGRYVMSCNRKCLVSEPWEQDYFPFEFFHWSPPVRGFWGSSAVTEIRPLETETNHLLQQAQAAMRLCANPMLLAPVGANLKMAKMTNEPGIKVEYEGQIPPTIFTPQPISPTVIEAAWSFYGKAFEIVGTNELGASGTKPPGIESGRALEQLGEEHQARFKHVSQAFEHVISTGCARQFVRLAKWLDSALKEKGDAAGYVLKSKAGKNMIKLAWSKVEMPPDSFFIATFPTSMLPVLPSGRIAEVERLQTMGVIDQSMTLELLDFPDIESVASPLRASFTLLEKQIEAMLERGQMQLPDERQNLQQCLTYGTAVLLSAIEDNAPEANIDRLRDYLAATEEMIEASLPPAPDPMVDAAMGVGPTVDPLQAMAPTPAPTMPPNGPGLPPTIV